MPKLGQDINVSGISEEDAKSKRCFVNNMDVTLSGDSDCIEMSVKAGSSVNFTMMAGDHNVFWSVKVVVVL